MSVFARPDFTAFAVRGSRMEVTRTMKPERLTIQGKWANVRRIVQELVTDGWRHETPEPNDDFTLTTVVMER